MHRRSPAGVLLGLLIAIGCTPTGTLVSATLPIPEVRLAPEANTFVVGYQGIVLSRPDGSVLRWNDELRPVAAPRTQGLVGFSNDLEVVMTLATDRMFGGLVPGRCETWSAPPVDMRQAMRGRRFYVLDANGGVWSAVDPARASTSSPRCSQERMETEVLDFRPVSGLDGVRQLVSAEPGLCVVDAAGTVRCVESVDATSGLWRLPSAHPVRVAISTQSGKVCGVDVEGAVICGQPFRDGHWRFPGSDRFVAIAARRDGICGLTEEGRVRCATPVLDIEDLAAADEPDFGDARLPISSRFIISTSVGSTSACVATDDDEVRCATAHEDPEDAPVPVTRLRRLDEMRDGVVVWGSSEAMTCALERAHGLRCWLRRSASEANASTDDEAPIEDEPRPPRTLEPPGEIRDLVVFDRTLCAVLTDDSVRCALVSEDAASAVAWESTAEDLRSIAAGSGVLCTVAGDVGALRCRGRITSEEGRFSRTFDPSRPLAIEGVATSFRSVAIGEGHLCAIVGDGTVACLGDGREGQLGLGRSRLTAHDLEVVPDLEDVNVLMASRDFTCAQTQGGAAYCWGDGVAFHPTRSESLEGGELLSIVPYYGYASPHLVGTELVGALQGGRTLLAPWSSRPLPELTPDGELPGYLWSLGPIHALCEYDSPSTSGDVTTCYVDAVIPSVSSLDPEALHMHRIEPTPDDLPPFPRERAASARMYVHARNSRPDHDCANTLVSYADGRSCGDLPRRGRPLSASEMASALRSVNDVANYPAGVILHCRDPEYEIVFFGASSQEVGRLLFGVECPTMSASERLPAQEAAGTNSQPIHNDFAVICRRLRMPGCEPRGPQP